ncbi:MAG: Gfo/Idh/MocA family oxidoreductase [Erysipelotrichaceae bacterium]|nr:Gfo/Idh/MocA family oxidoreductase [Erysipelotrichaceae bacterium]
MKKIKIGIIGPGTISHRFVKGARMVRNCEVYAVCGRSKERANQFALQYQIPYHGYYTDLIRDTNVDAIYVATPNETHYEIVKECLLHGKHVLCEKPMVTTEEELKELYAIAYEHNLVLMEAMKALFLPLTAKVKDIIESGELGEIKYLDGKYSYKSDLPMDHWAYHATSGGGLRDVGVYPLGYFNYLMDSKIETIQTMSRFAETGADAFTQAMITYENGVCASLVGGIDVLTENKAMIYGTKGYLEIVNFWKASEAVLHKGEYQRVIKAEMVSDFKYETEHFVECILKGAKESPVIGLEECLEIMRVYQKKEEAQKNN